MEQTKEIELLAELFEIESDKISPSVQLADLPQWDSLTQLGLVAVFKEHINKVLSPAELRAFETIQDILSAMSK
jgi:acyl carrier protein